MKIYLIIILSFIILIKAYSQNSEFVDSLKKVILKIEKKCPEPCNDDTNRIMAYVLLGEEIFIDYPDSAISLWREAEKISRQLIQTKPPKAIVVSSKKTLALAINNIGYVYKYLGKISKAIENYNIALSIQEEIDDKEGSSNTLINIGSILYNEGDISKSLEYFLKSLSVKQKINDKLGMAHAFNNLGSIYDDQGDIAKALEYYHKGLTLREEIGDKQGEALALNNIGYIYVNQGDFKNALDYYNKSLKIRLEIADKKGIANSYNNIASLYKNLLTNTKNKKDFARLDSLSLKALEYFKRSLSIRDEIGDKQGYAITLNNIGLIYNGMADEAELQGNKFKKDSLLNLSIECCERSLKIREEYGYKHDMASSLYNLARFYRDKNQISKFKLYAERSYKISKELGFPEDISNSASVMREIALMNGDYKKAYEYYQEQMYMKDSLQNEQNYRQTQQQQARYTYEKKAAIDSLAHDKAIQIKNLELAKTEQEKQKQRIVIYSFVFGFIIILIFSILLLRLFFQKKKANQLLSKQNAEISQQKEEIEAQRDEIETQRDQVQKQKHEIEQLYEIAVERKNIVEAQQVEIHDSIRYAKRIQQAILPDLSSKSQNLGYGSCSLEFESFIMFRPKDIVSGDFYWFAKVNDYSIYAVADCTGHGVPGAFMSMLGVSFLTEIVRRKEVTDAAMVLNNLRSSIIDALGQTGEEGTQKDGMDMSLIAIKPQAKSKIEKKPNPKLQNPSKENDGELINSDIELQTSNDKPKTSNIFEAQWAGANNPLWIVKSPKSQNQSPKHQEMETNSKSLGFELEACFLELKADKMPISIYERMESFTNHEIQLKAGDKIYLFSDGFPDQFGGSKGKKFLYKRFKDEICKSSSMEMKEQKSYLESVLNEWISSFDTLTNNKYEQTDDITVLGIKL